MNNLPKKLSYEHWLDNYFRCLYILSRTFQPNNNNNVYEKIAAKCFVDSLIQILPDEKLTPIFISFQNMDKSVSSFLLNDEGLENFFNFYSNYRDILKTNPNDFFEFCLNTPIGFFIWVYLLNYYVFNYINKSNIKKTYYSYI